MDFPLQYTFLKSFSTKYFKRAYMWGIWRKEEAGRKGESRPSEESSLGDLASLNCEETQPDGSEAYLNILSQFIIWLLGTSFQCSE